MSISSCPHCAKQVTLPVGVSNNAKVRCPLCHAEYTLADALVNMPPLLEVLEDVDDGASSDWLELPSEAHDRHHVEHSASLIPSSDLPADLVDEVDEQPHTIPVGRLGGEGDLGDLDFESIEDDHDDLAMLEQDTEVEELDFDGVAPSLGDRSLDDAPAVAPLVAKAVPDEESVLDFNRSHAAPTVTPVEAIHADDEPEFDFTAEEAEPHTIEHAPLSAELAGDEIGIDFGEPAASDFDQHESLDFGEPVAAEAHPIDSDIHAGDIHADDLHADFAEIPVVAPIAAVEVPQDAKGKKKKDTKKEKKEKKPREPKVAVEGKGKRSLVGSLVALLLSLLIAAPLALYGLLWLGPDGDYLRIGPGVAKWAPWAVPASFQPKNARQIAQAPPQMPQQLPAQDNAQPPAESEAPAEQTPADGSTTPLSNEAEPQNPTEPTTDQSPAETPTESSAVVSDAPVAEQPPAEAPAEEMPAEPASDATASDVPTENPAAEQPAEEMPAEVADEKPADAPEKTPAETPADTDLPPLSDTDAKPEESPAAEKPAEADGTASGTADAEDPFGPAASDAAKDADVPVEANPAEPAAETLGPREAPEFSLDDLAKAVQAATQADQKMTAAQASKDEQGIKAARKNFYLSWYGLADVLTFAKQDPASPQLATLREAAQQLVQTYAGDRKRLEALEYNAPRWLGFAHRTTSGIILAGTVQSSEQVGKLHQVKLKVGTASGSPIVTVVSATDPHFNLQEEAVILGSIVDHPDEQLAGYEGSGDAVVWSGLPLKVAAGK